MQNLFANSLQTSNAPSINPIRPKPVNLSYSQNASFDKVKTRHRFSPFFGVQREFISKSRHLNQLKCIKFCSGFGGAGAVPGMSGHRWGWAEGTKTMSGKELKRSPHPSPIIGLVTSSFGQRGERHLQSVSRTIFWKESFAMSGLNRIPTNDLHLSSWLP